ncbi:Stp1/IreP family PP2C-type Ser/Thr phosphatase [Salinicoccus halodurans]|uniref:Protein phosphatase n=1 Tax=Salinicoccus halodurans TaxID=407035 RepID=A0A0F7HLK7_9STAP|nr:Stp1/IreP family PP2C-type Ser/Thr phosphatase [Salinicoccus halodurans]AKG73738.1 protein phosphatase [Salinicoccus halodurans]SFK55106.1 protein phosphatase [Salinicoccus halodurans]
MRVVEKSICGNFRETNEDATGIFHNGTGQILIMVSDGMGGHQYGDVASSFVLDRIGEAWKSENLLDVDTGEQFLRNLVMKVNRSLYDYQEENPRYRGMGTTLVLAAFIEETIIILNVGDSRAYVMNPRSIEQVTKDHSFVNMLVDAGEITADEAKRHPKKNIITKAMGTDRLIQADVFRLRNRQYDYLIVASDGLTDEMATDEIHTLTYTSEKALSDKADDLIVRAEKNGSTDNISLVLADLKASESE